MTEQGPYRAIDPVGSVVVVLPMVGQLVLMQLRDEKHGITFPGQWGFFGGAMDPRETPLAAALRELDEEISWMPERMRTLGRHYVADVGGLESYGFACDLSVPLSQLNQREGMDMALLSIADIWRGTAPSPLLGRDFPLIRTRYIEQMTEAALALNL